MGYMAPDFRAKYSSARSHEYYFDVEQTPGRGSLGPMVPTLVSHGCMVSAHDNVLIGGLSHLEAMGESVWPFQKFEPFEDPPHLCCQT